jgi:hypothetical protein
MSSTTIHYEGSKLLGCIKAPPKRVPRQINLDPSDKKHGFHLVPYELHHDQGKLPRAIVKHVIPGSPAFIAGLYPGDQILKVNQEDYSRSHVSQVVNAIQNANPNRTLELTVAFVDGVKRLDLQAKGEETREILSNKQAQLRDLVVSEESLQRHSSSVEPPQSPYDELETSPWFAEMLSDEDFSLHIYPYDGYLNKILQISYDDITKLQCDMLVMPLRSASKCIGGKDIYKVLEAGGQKLLDELCLHEHCPLGANIITRGYSLPAQEICHCVYGNSDEDLISCCRSALEFAYEQEYQTIVMI